MVFNAINPSLCGAAISPKTERPLTFASKPRRKRIAGTTKAFAHRGIERPFNSFGGEHTVERVLRYPDGYERRIRYPISDDVPSATLTQSPTLETDYASPDEDFDPNAWTTHAFWNSNSNDTIDTADSNSTTAFPHDRPLADTAEPSSTSTTTPKKDEVPLSPLALLRLMTSDAYKIEERRIMDEVADSYTILSNGCPWPVPRPLFILSVVEADQIEDGTGNEDQDEEMINQQKPSAAGQAYALRVKMPTSGVEDELTKLLGNKTRPDGSPLIRCSHLKDGIITFEDEHQAESFGKLVENQRPGIRLSLAKCDSHALFRLCVEVSSVVVLMDKERGVEGLPPPHRLASSLRRQDEDW